MGRGDGLGYAGSMEGFELSASIALWRGDELLLMKRGEGFGGGGWFLPGGHVEAGERPAEAAVRELWEETRIVLEVDDLALADVMSYLRDGVMAHTLVYNALASEGVEPTLNDEHVAARWYTAEAAVGRFFDSGMLRGRGVPEDAITLAIEVGRVIRSAARARGMAAE